MTTGPGDDVAAGRGHLRASDADREQTIEVLKAAFARGGLVKDEFEARIGQAFVSRTYADLAGVTAGLTRADPDRRPARAQVGKAAASSPAQARAKKGGRLGRILACHARPFGGRYRPRLCKHCGRDRHDCCRLFHFLVDRLVDIDRER